MDGLRIDRNRSDTIQAYLNENLPHSQSMHMARAHSECTIPPPETVPGIAFMCSCRVEGGGILLMVCSTCSPRMYTKYQYVEICSTKCGHGNIIDGFGFSLHNINVCFRRSRTRTGLV